MGVIVDQNSDASANDRWALVNGTNVSTMVVANLAFITGIQGSYDYLVDVTVGGQTADTNYTYTSGTDSFTPPAIDWISIVQTDMDAIVGTLAQCLSDASNLSPTDLATAISNSLSDSSPSFTANEADLFTAISTYISGGG